MTARRGQRPRFRRHLRTIGLGLLIALIARTFMLEPFHVPSTSMEPTLIPGDFLMASKFAYGYGFAPSAQNGPERGDVVVFRNERDGGRSYVKRVIAIAGDEVWLASGVVSVNGEEARLAFNRRTSGKTTDGVAIEVLSFEEVHPTGARYEVQQFLTPEGDQLGVDDTSVIRVPEGHVFVLGDNRDDSVDSRHSSVGFVPIDAVVGRASFIAFSGEDAFRGWAPWTWGEVRGERTFKSIMGET